MSNSNRNNNRNNRRTRLNWLRYEKYGVKITDTKIKTVCSTNYHQFAQEYLLDKFGESTDPCLRLKHKTRDFDTDTQKLKIGNRVLDIKLTKSAMSFIHKYEWYPDNVNNDERICLSHICGNNSCIQASHMIIEPQSINGQRYGCHNHILRFIQKYKNKKKHAIKSGKLTVHYVNTKLRQFKSDIKPHVCSHKNTYACFINYRQL